jgi:hypothetical protein
MRAFTPIRTFVIVAGLALGLAACQPPKSETAETTPAPKKYQSRSATLYAGQEQILQVDSATVEPSASGDRLILKAVGKTATGGYYELSFQPRINAVQPADGVYDVDVLGYRPPGAATQALTAVEVKGEWAGYPKARLKGVRLVTKTNDLVAMLPPT